MLQKLVLHKVSSTGKKKKSQITYKFTIRKKRIIYHLLDLFTLATVKQDIINLTGFKMLWDTHKELGEGLLKLD